MFLKLKKKQSKVPATLSHMNTDGRYLKDPIAGMQVYVKDRPEGIYIRVADNYDATDTSYEYQQSLPAEVLLNETTLYSDTEKVLWIHHMNVQEEFVETYLPKLVNRVICYATNSGYKKIATTGKTRTLPMESVRDALLEAGFRADGILYILDVENQ